MGRSSKSVSMDKGKAIDVSESSPNFIDFIAMCPKCVSLFPLILFVDFSELIKFSRFLDFRFNWRLVVYKTYLFEQLALFIVI